MHFVCQRSAQSGQKPDWKLYCDSDHGADKVTRKSRYGSVAELQGFPVHYKTQTTSVAMSVSAIGPDGSVCISSTESEIYAISNGISHILRLQYICEELGRDFPKPFVMFMDNAAAEIFCNNTASYSRLQNIDQRQKWVKQMRDKQIMIPVHIHTSVNLADMFTKPLTGSIFHGMCKKWFVNLKQFKEEEVAVQLQLYINVCEERSDD